MESKLSGAGDASPRKPAGGFCLVSGTLLSRAWAAYRRGDLHLLDLRVWFACLELVARRCVATKGIRPKYRIDEIRSLVGGAGGEHLRHAVRRLEKSRLVIWGESCITVPKCDDSLVDPDYDRMCEHVANHRRLVPVPRRIVRLIAGGARRVVIATILGHLLRCLYYRNGRCEPEGSCKASWITEVFGVSLRNVKSARQHLVSIGWLLPVVCGQTYLNRFGQRMRINLEWSRNDKSLDGKRSPPPAFSTTGSAPPYKDKKLSSRFDQHQKPAHGPAGVFKQNGRGTQPTLRHVVAEDLRDPTRLLELFRQAVIARLVSTSECDRLRFFAAAEHAKTIGTRNPCGLFVTVVRRRLWQFATQGDEDAARRRLRWLAMQRPAIRNGDNVGQTILSKREQSLTDSTEPVAIRAIIERSLGKPAEFATTRQHNIVLEPHRVVA
ncbi:hypothetical protein RAS2_18240 [Phycisphaerae bacterium RAS2]|nr:hypothetical protein RAS2_18240 [Phycisphaerae bacterium RAS2]